VTVATQARLKSQVVQADNGGAKTRSDRFGLSLSEASQFEVFPHISCEKNDECTGKFSHSRLAFWYFLGIATRDRLGL